MINSISISNVATYPGSPQVMGDLAKINFIFGSNGSGKTTITRIACDETPYPSCKVAWEGRIPMQVLAYNRDFVSQNFKESPELKGIFTLGEKAVETLKKIAEAKLELDRKVEALKSLTLALQGEDGVSGMRGELVQIENEFRNNCWAQKQKHDAKFAAAFEGFRNNAERFKNKILLERGKNSAPVQPLAQLEKKADTVFGPAPSPEQNLPAPKLDLLMAHEESPILKKRVIGKNDVDIAAMINKLGNSDWVKEGRKFYEANESVCPFCQQPTSERFKKSLGDYFDQTFLADTEAIDNLLERYTFDSTLVQKNILAVIATQSKFLDIEAVKSQKSLLDSKITINLQRLASKKKEPSQLIALESISNVAADITKLIHDANAAVSEHNKMVSNLTQERAALTTQVWKHIVEVELRDTLNSYDTKHQACCKAIEAISKKCEELKGNIRAKEAEIRALEKETTSIQPTIDGINALLSSFGFNGFSLAKAAEGPYYKLIRANGMDAKETLSEGEETFVTFLYFYHLLKGSESSSGMTTDRIVFFDDPVSSLDSDILFVVSSLVKGLFDEVRAGTGNIKQVFILTHNVYFHKEVTFNPKRTYEALSDESFWIVRKSGLESRVERHASNPIKTSYQLLWSEVKREDRNNLAIQNTLRRILENYFKILGGVDPDNICSLFEGKEKLVCRSLFSWVNDGSHFAHDDVYVSIDGSMVEMYLHVFKSVFEKSGHLAHYQMMMGEPGTSK